MEQEIVTQPEAGVIIFEQFKEKVIQTFDGQIVEKVNPLRQRLGKLKEEYAGAEVVTDPASMKRAKEATAAFRTFKGVVEDNRKILKGLVLQLGDSVDSNHNPIKDEAEEWQKKMDTPAKAFEEEQKAKRNAEKIALAKRKALRFDQLTQLGAFTSSGVFILGDETAMEDTVELCTDDGFNEILSRFKSEKEKNDAEAAEVEKKRQEEAKNLREEQERLRVQREEMIKQEQAIREQREALHRQKEEFEKKELKRIAEEEEKKLLAKTKKENDLFDKRIAQLNDISWNGQSAEYGNSIVIRLSEIIEFSDEDFNMIRDTHNKRVADDKADTERKRLEEEEKQSKEKELDDRFARREAQLKIIGLLPAAYINFLRDMPDEKYAEYYSEYFKEFEKKKHDEWLESERIKKLQEEEREKERLAELTDGERWRVFKNELSKFAANMPDFPTGRYARMKAIALEKFGEIQSLRRESFKGNK